MWCWDVGSQGGGGLKFEGFCPAVRCWDWSRRTRVKVWGPSSACKGLSTLDGAVFRAGLSFLVWASHCRGHLTCTPARSEPAGIGQLAWGQKPCCVSHHWANNLPESCPCSSHGCGAAGPSPAMSALTKHNGATQNSPVPPIPTSAGVGMGCPGQGGSPHPWRGLRVRLTQR